MRFFRPFLLSSWLFPEAVTRIRTSEKLIWLTFDDGPDPDSTPWILEILQSYNIKATFFCTGKSAGDYPELMTGIRMGGHIIGNHGYMHIDGWFTGKEDYIRNAEKAVPFTSGWLFRPPYGRLTPGQYNILSEKFRIILWDLMPYDFDRSFTARDSLNILMDKMRTGSIIVLHDKPDSSSQKYLDEFIGRSLDKGYDFVSVPDIK